MVSFILGVKFKISDEHSRLFHMGVPPPPPSRATRYLEQISQPIARRNGNLIGLPVVKYSNAMSHDSHGCHVIHYMHNMRERFACLPYRLIS